MNGGTSHGTLRKSGFASIGMQATENAELLIEGGDLSRGVTKAKLGGGGPNRSQKCTGKRLFLLHSTIGLITSKRLLLFHLENQRGPSKGAKLA